MDAPTQAWGRLPLQAKQFWPASSTSSCRAWSLDRGWCSENQFKYPRSSWLSRCCPLISDHREPGYQIFKVLSLSQLVLEEKNPSAASGKCFSCQIGKLNELMMESKMSHLFKTSLNPGCLIVAGYSTALSHTSFTLPVRPLAESWPHKQGAERRPISGQIGSRTWLREIHVIWLWAHRKYWSVTQKLHTDSRGWSGLGSMY